MPFRNFVMRQFGIRRKLPAATLAAGHAADDISQVIAGHARFQNRFAADREFYGSLVEKQSPRLLWIGCSDSRVVPDVVLDADPGALFVVRNIGNLVPPANTQASISVGAAIEYAVTVLSINDIVICGHTHCGGVAALAQEKAVDDASHLAQWIDIARQGYDPSKASTLEEAVQANVLWQLRNLLTYKVVRTAWEAGTLNIHGWIYDIETGAMLAYNDVSKSWGTLGESRVQSLLDDDERDEDRRDGEDD